MVTLQMTSQRNPLVIAVHPEGNTNVCRKFCGNPSYRHFTQNHKWKPHGGAREKVGFILSEP